MKIRKKEVIWTMTGGIPIEVTIFSKVKKRMQEMKRFFKEQGLELARINQYGVFATAN